MNRRAVSHQVATILLVGFTVALAIIAFLWMRNYLEERAAKEGKLSEKQLECGNLQIEVTNTYQKGSYAFITIKNLKDSDIGKFTFRLIGTKRVEPREDLTRLKGFEIAEYSVLFDQSGGNSIEKIDTIPWIKVARDVYVPCSSKVVSSRVTLLE